MRSFRHDFDAFSVLSQLCSPDFCGVYVDSHVCRKKETSHIENGTPRDAARAPSYMCQKLTPDRVHDFRVLKVKDAPPKESGVLDAEEKIYTTGLSRF